jgi:hypothetical protein
MEEQKRQPGCPCCGTLMVVVSETETKINLKCPVCLVSDLRIK